MKTLLTIIATLGTLCSLSAQNSGGEVLKKLSAAVEALSPYRIDFTVSAPDAGEAQGFFIVDGRRYRMDIEGEQQFSDGEHLYGVSNLNREVVVDSAQPESRNILVNPSRAFDLADEGLFAWQVVTESAASIAIELVPSEEVLQGIDKILVEVDPQSYMPLKLTYDFGGTRLTVRIDAVVRILPDEKLFRFDPSLYTGYEIIEM